MIPRSSARRDGGFSLVEVLVATAILASAVVMLQSALGGAVDRAIMTKVNRQLRHLAQHQFGQVTVGKMHADEDDPFLDGQTGAFDDVGGFADEYVAFSWEVSSEEVAICGASNLELTEAGFSDDGSGLYSRAVTDDVAAAAETAAGAGPGGGDQAGSGGFDAMFGNAKPKPVGQYKRRVVLRVRYAAASAEDDRVLTLITLVPTAEEGPLATGPAGGVGGAGGAAGQNPPEGGQSPGAGTVPPDRLQGGGR